MAMACAARRLICAILTARTAASPFVTGTTGAPGPTRSGSSRREKGQGMAAVKRLLGILALALLLAGCGDGASGDNLSADVEPSGSGLQDEVSESAQPEPSPDSGELSELVA